jgi:hypothetical protein
MIGICDAAQKRAAERLNREAADTLGYQRALEETAPSRSRLCNIG